MAYDTVASAIAPYADTAASQVAQHLDTEVLRLLRPRDRHTGNHTPLSRGTPVPANALAQPPTAVTAQAVSSRDTNRSSLPMW